MSGLLGASRDLYSHQNTARRTEAHLKRRQCVTPVSSSIMRRTRLISLYAVLSREAELMVAVLTVHVAANALKVSEKFGITQSILSRLWQRFQDDGNVSRCYSTGHPRVTTPNEDRYLAVTAKTNRRSTASDLSRQLSSATGTTVSRQTVYRRLERIGLYARRPVR
ncbi:HTH_Tnp_Tc3_2 domain-containing protein [Trichonephila clavipes]|nr:HTH_Tnp_Tc3_2 domain-containing protein [Trichonephila clavipes]